MPARRDGIAQQFIRADAEKQLCLVPHRNDYDG